ncbi:MAG: DNA glycosylase [Clostridia bacterium]|nr:DNA glycosylase [Clostridia bacterium]
MSAYPSEIIGESTVDGVKTVRIRVPEFFSVRQIFDCGQCFRFDPAGDPDDWSYVRGVAFGRSVCFRQNGPDEMVIEGSGISEYETVWKRFLSLDTDYDAIRIDIRSRFPKESVMDEAMRFGSGIRILRQDPFETLISFIISQNNNIPRIKKLVNALCVRAGKRISRDSFSFPGPEEILSLGTEGLRELKTGFRAGYIYDAAEKIASGELDLGDVEAAESTRKASEMLCTVKGVGPKVAACTLLFGFGRLDAFPVDVWIRRSFERHFGGSLDIGSLGESAGLAQQYLFYYERYNRDGDK